MIFRVLSKQVHSLILCSYNINFKMDILKRAGKNTVLFYSIPGECFYLCAADQFYLWHSFPSGLMICIPEKTTSSFQKERFSDE